MENYSLRVPINNHFWKYYKTGDEKEKNPFPSPSWYLLKTAGLNGSMNTNIRTRVQIQKQFLDQFKIRTAVSKDQSLKRFSSVTW